MGWLMLSRKREEEIVIGDELVVVKVTAIGIDQVKLAVHAPGLSIDRREIFDAKKRGDPAPASVELRSARAD